MSDTNLSPAAATATLAGITLSLVSGTVTARVPTVSALALGGVAPSVIVQQQNPDTATTINLLKSDSQTGILKRWPGGAGTLVCCGTWGGATVTLTFAGPDGATMVPVGTTTTLTANGMGSFNLPPGLIQAAISNASGSTSLSAAVQATPTLIG